jgi:hypothetical protein
VTQSAFGTNVPACPPGQIASVPVRAQRSDVTSGPASQPGLQSQHPPPTWGSVVVVVEVEENVLVVEAAIVLVAVELVVLVVSANVVVLMTVLVVVVRVVVVVDELEGGPDAWQRPKPVELNALARHDNPGQQQLKADFSSTMHWLSSGRQHFPSVQGRSASQ